MFDSSSAFLGLGSGPYFTWLCDFAGGSAIYTRGVLVATDCTFTRLNARENGFARFIETLGPAGIAGLVAMAPAILAVGTQARLLGRAECL